jgi:hypothetical protein
MRRVLALGLAAMLSAAPALARSKSRAVVKQLKDSGASGINFTAKEVTVKWLNEQQRPGDEELKAAASTRIAPLENQLFRVKANLVKYEAENDGDVKLFLADPSDPSILLLAEVPEGECVAASYAPKLDAVRAELKKRFGNSSPAKPVSITVEGVGYWGFIRGGQTASNGLQLHPVLSIRFE